ncbi:DNA-binding protein [Sulfurimonas aquatica]|uniref:DNA-binding protein n=1 Tax=Sulfurimonas aquatica TaxID=2672570 RepID=A0A975GBV5_9BACT|nr:DNA-binding protein [Sulfurimonas aquatica]QSZ40628.1 DNA-binding protein [Sulfurimonas aquatica]
MSKMSVSDAAEHFGVSKEAIHNRIRRGSLKVVVEDGIKMVIIDPLAQSSKSRVSSATQKSSTTNDRYYKLLAEQNEKLQSRIAFLEDETRTLRDQKELMLIEERKKIEQIYKDKDEQLKNILSSISSQFMLPNAKEEELEVEALEVEIEPNDEVEDDVSYVISLKKYLNSTKLSDKKREKIQKRFAKHAQKDKRITTIGKKYYIDTSKYDYSDLIR